MGNMISVILPVYNGAETIRRAVDSILAQTYQDFEFIIINDGSTDATPQILKSYNDARIQILPQENRGLVRSLNRGILASQGKYLARMDADDVALPERFEKQLNFLETHPTVAVLGTAARVIYGDGTENIRRRPLNTEAIRKNIIRICPFSHSSVMIRRAVLDKVGLYDTNKCGSKRLLVEDYDLWVRILAAGYDLANLAEPLMLYYREPNSILRSRSLTKRLKQQIYSRLEIMKILKLKPYKYINLLPIILLSSLSHYNVKLDKIFNLLSRKQSDINYPIS